MLWIGGKANLIVDHDMDGAAGPVAAKLRHIQAFGNNALAGESGIAMQQKPHDFFARLVAAHGLFGTHLAQDHRVDAFQMRWIGGQRQMHIAFGEFPVGGRAQMIFHIARSLHVVGMRRVALKFGKDGHIGFAHGARQQVEPAPVRHADHHFLDAHIGGGAQHPLDTRDHAFAAIEAKPLGAGMLDLQIVFEAFGLDHILVDAFFQIGGKIGSEIDAFHLLLNPGALLDILDMHIFDADGRAVGGAHDLQNFS